MKDIDLDGHKLLIRNNKGRKDRMVYISGTVAMALQQHLAIHFTQTTGCVFASKVLPSPDAVCKGGSTTMAKNVAFL
jgi:site-specific recombinase XerD